MYITSVTLGWVFSGIFTLDLLCCIVSIFIVLRATRTSQLRNKIFMNHKSFSALAMVVITLCSLGLFLLRTLRIIFWGHTVYYPCRGLALFWDLLVDMTLLVWVARGWKVYRLFDFQNLNVNEWRKGLKLRVQRYTEKVKEVTTSARRKKLSLKDQLYLASPRESECDDNEAFRKSIQLHRRRRNHTIATPTKSTMPTTPTTPMTPTTPTTFEYTPDKTREKSLKLKESFYKTRRSMSTPAEKRELTEIIVVDKVDQEQINNQSNEEKKENESKEEENLDLNKKENTSSTNEQQESKPEQITDDQTTTPSSSQNFTKPIVPRLDSIKTLHSTEKSESETKQSDSSKSSSRSSRSSSIFGGVIDSARTKVKIFDQLMKYHASPAISNKLLSQGPKNHSKVYWRTAFVYSLLVASIAFVLVMLTIFAPDWVPANAECTMTNFSIVQPFVYLQVAHHYAVGFLMLFITIVLVVRKVDDYIKTELTVLLISTFVVPFINLLLSIIPNYSNTQATYLLVHIITIVWIFLIQIFGIYIPAIKCIMSYKISSSGNIEQVVKQRTKGLTKRALSRRSMYRQSMGARKSRSFALPSRGNDTAVSREIKEKYTFERVMHDKLLRNAFRDLLMRLLCAEGLCFWEDVQLYKTIKSVTKRRELASEIISRYIESGGPMELNISSYDKMATIEKLQKLHDTCPTNLFKDLEMTVKYTLKSDCYAKFLESQQFTQYLRSVGEL